MRAKDPTAWKFVFLVLGIVAVLLALRYTPLSRLVQREQLRDTFETIAATPWSGTIFVLALSIGLCFGLPATPFTLVGGVVFGLWPGALYNWLGTTVGAGLAFLVARYLGRPYVQGMLGDRLQRMDEAVARRGFWAIFTMRMIPIIPFNLSNFAAGLTRISFVEYIVATGLAPMPGLTIITFFADRIWRGEGQDVYYYLSLASILMLLMALLPWIHQRRTERPDEPMTAPAAGDLD